MNLRIHLRSLGIGAVMLVATSVVGGSVMRVQAQDNNPFGGHTDKGSCEASGHLWDDVKGCADNYCLDGLFGYGDPGETQSLGSQVWMCDGFSGRWIQVFSVHPTNPRFPVAPHPIGNAPTTNPGPSGPTVPVHVGGNALT